jgi:nitrogen PTS system EIIA component
MPHSQTFHLGKLLILDHIVVGLEVTSKKRLFEEIGFLFERTTALNRALVTDSLFARERLGTTGLGHGVAIPHGRIKGLKEPHLAVVQLASPIPFEAVDDLPVALLFVLLVPENATQKHLDLLAEIAELLSDDVIRDRFKSASSPEQIHTIVTEGSLL